MVQICLLQLVGKKLYSGDGMDCAIDPNDNNIMYVSTYRGSFYKSSNGGNYFRDFLNPNVTGEDGEWVTPFAIDPSNPGTVYAGFSELWRNTNYGGMSNWTKVSNFNLSSKIDFIAVAPSNSNYIYLAVDGVVKFTSDGGTTWNQLFVASRFVTSIAVNPTDPTKIWVSLSGFSPSEKVYYYNGTKLINMSGNLPNAPVNTIAYQKDSPDRVYIGTDIGIYYADHLSNIWTNYSGEVLPNLIVSEIEIYSASNPPKLRAATYGRGIWEANSFIENNPPIPLYHNGQIIADFDTFHLCYGNYIEISAADSYSNYVWNDGTTNKTIKISEPGLYSVKATNGSGDSKSSCIQIIVDYPNQIAITNKVANAFCIGDTVELTASLGFGTYNWSTGATSRKISISQSGTYYVIGKQDSPCFSYSDTLNIVFYPYPEKPIITKDGLVLSTQEATKYQWYLNGVILKNDTNRTFNIKNIGSYQVEIKNEGLCAALSDTFVVTKEMGITESDLNDVSVYPNPSTGDFNLKINGSNSQSLEYTITNSLGAELLNYTGVITQDNFKQSIYLSSYVSGVYFLKLKIGNNSRIIKLIKK